MASTTSSSGHLVSLAPIRAALSCFQGEEDADIKELYSHLIAIARGNAGQPFVTLDHQAYAEHKEKWKATLKLLRLRPELMGKLPTIPDLVEVDAAEQAAKPDGGDVIDMGAFDRFWRNPPRGEVAMSRYTMDTTSLHQPIDTTPQIYSEVAGDELQYAMYQTWKRAAPEHRAQFTFNHYMAVRKEIQAHAEKDKVKKADVSTMD